MKPEYKWTAGISFLLTVIFLTIRAKANAAAVKNTTGAQAALPLNEKDLQAQEIFKRAMAKLPNGYVPIEMYVTGGHIFSGMLNDELEQLWALGYDLTAEPPAPGQSVSDKMGKGEVPILEKMTPEFYQCYKTTGSYTGCSMDLIRKAPGVVGIAAYSGNNG